MADGSGSPDKGFEEESEHERLHRQLLELISELRVALPGVQVLFAFLLTVPFQQRFADVSSFERYVYFVTLLLSATASALLIAPSAYHRILFRKHDLAGLLDVANRLAIAGLACLALAISGAVLLITSFLYGDDTAATVAALVAAMIGVLWFGAPLVRRARAVRRAAER